MTSVWFVVPAHGRFSLTAVCLRQLARTCDALADEGVAASAVVIADDENFETADALGFATVRRENRPLGRRWNDGYELAAKAGVDYVVALGSDDWIDHRLVLAQLEGRGEIRCSRLSSVVSEDGRRLTPLRIGYEGGDGVRMLPTALLKRLRYRPAEEDRERAIDTSIMRRLREGLGRAPLVSYADVHPCQIVDWKSRANQLNSYADCLGDGRLRHEDYAAELDPWTALAEHYPAEALAEMRALYGIHEAVAA